MADQPSVVALKKSCHAAAPRRHTESVRAPEGADICESKSSLRRTKLSHGSECVESFDTVIYSQLPPRSSDSPVHSLPITLAPLTFYRTTRLGFEGFTSIGFLELFGRGYSALQKLYPSETAPFSAAYSTQRERLQTWQ